MEFMNQVVRFEPESRDASDLGSWVGLGLKGVRIDLNHCRIQIMCFKILIAVVV